MPAGRSAPCPPHPVGLPALGDGCTVRQPQRPRSSAGVCPGFSWEVATVDEPFTSGFSSVQTSACFPKSLKRQPSSFKVLFWGPENSSTCQ